MNRKEYKELSVHMVTEIKKSLFHEFERREVKYDILTEHITHIARLKKTLRTFQFAVDESAEDQQNRDLLRNSFLSLKQATHFNKRLICDSGVADLIQDNYEGISENIQVKDIPQQDYELLKEAGVCNPKRELRRMIRTFKAQKELLKSKDVKLSNILIKADELAEQEWQRFIQKSAEISNEVSEKPPIKKKTEQPNEPQPQTTDVQNVATEEQPVKRKKWSGWGKVCKGTLITVADTAPIVGAWLFLQPLAPLALGASASIAGGIGDIMEGVGALKGE